MSNEPPPSLSSVSALAGSPSRRLRAQQQRLLLGGAAVFAMYYLLFFGAGVYSLPSLASGLAMAAGLAVVGWVTPSMPDTAERPAALFVAAVLSCGACISAAFSDGTHCIGFHTLWALPLIYGVFVRDDWVGSVVTTGLTLVGGVMLLLHDGESASRMAQWLTLIVSAGVFAIAQQSLNRQNLATALLESDLARTRLAVADRMASIGLLAASVAHEIRNPLSYVGTNLVFARRRLRDQDIQMSPQADGELFEVLSDAIEGCDRVAAIVRTLSRLSRAEQGSTTDIDLNSTIEDVLRLSRRDLNKLAEIEVFAGEVPRIRGDEARIGQVLLNLLVNAAQAGQGRREGSNLIQVRTYTRPPDRVVVEISDTGCGISAENLRHIFEPFFTTKPAGQGTGLGLALCAEILRAHGGTLEVESTLEKGSTFRAVFAGGEAHEHRQVRAPAGDAS